MTQGKKPALRFKGFDNDWEQRKLGELATFNKGAGYSKSDLKASGTQIILYGRLYTKYETVIKQVDTFVDSRPGSIYSEGGEVIVPASGETAEDIAIASVVEKPGILLGGDLNIIHPIRNLDSTFLAISISNGEPHKEMAKRAQGKSVVHLHNDDLSQIKFRYPSIEEQSKISKFFSNLDNLITLHQRKLEKLQNLKKAMLEKMFPKNGAKVPEIRFKGFTNDWEQRKLGNECFEIVAGGDVDKTKLLQDGKYPVIANALTDEGIIGYYSNEYRIKAPAVTVTGRGDVGHARARKINFTPVVRLLSVVSKHDVDFLAESINQNDIVLESTGVPQLTVPALANYLLCFPPTIKEEKRIGQYFSQLNHLLPLHQRKLEKLQNLKKAMLEKMFI